MPAAFLDPACPLDWSHPLNRGLVGEWSTVPNSGWRGGLTCRDLVRGGHNPHDGTLTNGPTWVGGQRRGGFGGLSFDGSSGSYVEVGSDLGMGAAGKFFVCGWVYPRSSPAEYSCLFEAQTTGGTGDNHFGCFLNPSGQLALYSGGTSIDGTGPALPANAWTFFGYGNDGAALTTWVNGVLGFSQGGVTLTLSGSTLFRTGSRGAAAARANAVIDGLTAFTRVPSAGHIAALYDQTRRGNPDRWRWVSSRAWSGPAGGNAYTLAVSQQSYAVATNAAGLFHAWNLAPATRTYAVATQGVGLLHGWVIAPATRAFTVTCNAVGLLKGRTLAVATATYAVATNAAGLLKTWALPLTRQTYALATNAAGLLHARTLAVTTRAFAVSANAAGLLKAWTLGVARQTYAVTAAAVSLVSSGGAVVRHAARYLRVPACLSNRSRVAGRTSNSNRVP